MKAGLNLFEKQLIYNSEPLRVLTTAQPKTLTASYKHAGSFEILFVVDNTGKISKGKSLSKRTFEFCLILVTEGRRKLQFGELSV